MENTMDSVLQELKDDRDIRALLYRYCRGIDRADVDMVRSVYLSESYDDHGTFKGSGYDFAAFAVEKLSRQYVATMHALHNCTVEVDGDKAAAETYFVAYQVTQKPGGGQQVLMFGGRYLDRLGREDGRWGIAYRQVVHDWTTTIDAAAWPAETIGVFNPSSRGDRKDPVYEFLSSTAAS
jgi:hypothetical protein